VDLKPIDIVLAGAGVRVTVEPEGDWKFVAQMEPGDSEMTGLTVGGIAVEVRNGELCIGEKSYGGVNITSTVRISAVGVRVDREFRGDLPSQEQGDSP
jgi:hypothetical protein